MNIISATLPAWADEAQTMIELTLEVEGLGVIPFAASPNDVETHGRDLYARAVAGEFGTVAALSAEKVAANLSARLAREALQAKQAEVAQARADAKADTFVQQFVEMTPAQVIAYVNANVSTLADAKQLLTKLSLMMLAMAKEQYK